MWQTSAGGLLEAKNVVNLSMSDQLRAQIRIATQRNQPLNLVVSARTQNVSRPLLRAVRSTGGNVFVYDVAAGMITPW